jgi:formate-dependent nitrite reductase membrane component NrfD
MEERITSGRFNPGIDPVLDSWHLPIPLYLFLGGVAAGIMFFASLYTILGREKELPSAVKWSVFLVPPALIIGITALLIDLNHKLFFWRLFTSFKIESPMSWGAWVLMLITPLSIIWVAPYIREIYPSWNWKFRIIERFESWITLNRKLIAWPVLMSSVILGIYTGILLSAFNARPLWNTSILGPLFLVSGLSTGAAAIMIVSRNYDEIRLFSKIDLWLILAELFLITHFIMGMKASTQVQINAIDQLLTGTFGMIFWGGIIITGLVAPAVLEIFKLRGAKIPVALPSSLILLGGLILRILIVEVGQISSYA